MSNKRKIVFLTGTRADFGKIKSLITAVEAHQDFDPYVFVTGMHLMEAYGYTLIEVERCGFSHVHTFENQTHETTMDLTLCKTIEGFSSYIKAIVPDLIIVHGDRVEALAGAIVGSLNNVLVAHIEGGELSGTIDELIRHSVSKLSHIHYTSNDEAKQRLIQMGELPESIFTIGSPDIDIMFSDQLPSLETAKAYYEIDFDTYALVLYHPVTTEVDQIEQDVKHFVDALTSTETSYIVVYPNNDLGSQMILKAYQPLKTNPKFRIFPSLRFEYFLTLLKHANFIIGNSSAGIREAPYYGIPSINIGSRQHNRATLPSVINCDAEVDDILGAISKRSTLDYPKVQHFGIGDSTKKFMDSINSKSLWALDHQKQFKDIYGK
ncbi:MAG: UDP-N-acetylglucosamine 2-epimerase [Bacteroidota bacterium]